MATLSATEELNESPSAPREIEVPAPTASPFILALGAALLFAGLVTSTSVSCLGVLLSMAGSVGWFREVFPREHEEVVPILPEDIRLTTIRRVVERLPVLPDQVRAWLPVHTYPISAGVKGGLAGSLAMAVLACAYGALKVGSIWYPINLLAAVVYRESLRLGAAQLYSFHADAFAIAFVLHGVVSIFVGLLYGAMLPMFPRRPIVLGGLIALALWSGLLYTILGLLNPLLASRIDWLWFMASQVAFGIVAGLVVVRQESSPTRENISFVLRAGIEAPGTIPPRESGGEPLMRMNPKLKQIRTLSAFPVLSLVLCLMLLAACSTLNREPQTDPEPVAPSQVLDFDTLYAQNCAGCHGVQGRGGASIALANPVYLAVVDEPTMRKIVAKGVRGTSMPAFAQSAGGMLTEQQIEVITSGILSRWGREGILDGSNPPLYAAKSAGNVDRGQLVYGTYCASCHGSEGGGTQKGSAITNDSFLALVSDQALRTIVITGRPELGAPDWRGNVPGRSMTDQEITDVVAWLASRRAQNPGQPYSASNYAQHSEK